MALIQLGSKGSEVAQIQTALKEKGLYLGPIDSDFGGGTESAVRRYQQREGLTVDGKVGPVTWKRLFNEEMSEREVTRKPLAFRCLALTGAFETSLAIPECFAGLTGDFDGQGISFGALQWNFGQKSLQPLLLEMKQKHLALLKEILGDHFDEFAELLASDQEEQMEWAHSIQGTNHKVSEPWRGLFKTLGRQKEFQDIQVASAKAKFEKAKQLCTTFQVRSERAVAQMFDIVVQNGSINNTVKSQILQDYQGITATEPLKIEVARMRIIAQRRAATVNPKFRADVLSRKLTIANGSGIVHGSQFNLEEDYGIRLNVNG